MLAEVDIERIMAAQRQLAESVAVETAIDEESHEYFDEHEMFEMLDYDPSVSETNGLM